MSYTETDFQFEDEIIRLARDPNLNREKGKTSKLISIINGFPLAERTVSRLCQLSLSLLQTLEKIELNLRNWAFMSLDFNSANHFDSANPDEIKTFNNNVSVRVIDSCQELTVKLNKISTDLDFITKASRSLTPLEFLSDSGTLLTSLSLRNIKLKDELREKVTVAYSKAKLITIGTNLESMLAGGSAEQRSTVESYKQFVVSLLDQLNAAVTANDDEDKNECLAVISDMEQMFEVFKLEYMQGMAESEAAAVAERSLRDAEGPKPGPTAKEPSVFTPQMAQMPQMEPTEPMAPIDTSELAETELDMSELPDTSFSMQSVSPSYSQPMVHSITKPSPHTPSDSSSVIEQHARRGSFSSVASTSILQKSTLSEELPYLMSAFNSAKTLGEDVFHFKDEGEKEAREESTQQETSSSSTTSSDAKPQRHFPASKTRLPPSPLYSGSEILSVPPPVSASSYVYSNSSLLSKLGIKPQVITASLPRHLNESASFNKAHALPYKTPLSIGSSSGSEEQGQDNKENKQGAVVPLTRANLNTHNLSALTPVDIRLDASADYVE